MVWDYDEALWQRNYRAAEEYYRDYGGLNIPILYRTRDGINLGSWIGRLRRDYKNGTLPREKIESMEAIGMIWSVGRGRAPRTVRGGGARRKNSSAGAVKNAG